MGGCLDDRMGTQRTVMVLWDKKTMLAHIALSL